MNEIIVTKFTFLKHFLVIFALVWQGVQSLAGDDWCPGGKVSLANASVYRQVTPRGMTGAGRFFKMPQAHRLEDCAIACCQTTDCHVVFMFGNSCFLVECISDKLCEPVRRRGKKFNEAYMIPLRSVTQDVTETTSEHFPDNLFSDVDDVRMLLRPESMSDDRSGEDDEALDSHAMRQLVLRRIKACEFGVGDCPKNEECVTKNSRSRQGLCGCVHEYVRDKETGKCRKEIVFNGTTSSPAPIITTQVSIVTTEPGGSTTEEGVNIKKLVVSAGENKVIQLPEDEVTLSAYAMGGAKGPTETYLFEWTLLSHPESDDAGTMGDKNLATLKLTKLKEGLYTFKVTVTGAGEGETGEATVNVTVLPPKRINKRPTAIINPGNQTVKLPNTDTVLDGSASSDDVKIVRYHWEQVSAPINYAPDLSDTATLQLKNLVPGFYRFMLTVTDSDGASNSTYANVTVIKEMDYPPVANAGADVIIYLPLNEVTLSGNLSTDDKGIKSWEWMKGPDTNKAVDMQNTHTPFLRLSSLEVGMYTFILKVTDTADQSAETVVRVFVKQEDNENPVADAGPDVEILLPTDDVILDGSKSHDDVGIKSWEWKQLSGPNLAKLDAADHPKTNATGLTKGIYVFQLTVVDEKKVSNSKTVTVTVKQTENVPPKANAGGNKIIQLPASVVVLNGSDSTDDLKIVDYHWTRDPTSLAAGLVLENSEKTSILKMTNLIPGRYIFQLKVTDDQGATNTDTVSLIVKPDPYEKEDVEMQINADIFWFSEEQKVTLAKKLALLLHDEGEINVEIKSITAARHSGRVILVFQVNKKTDSGNSLVIRGPDVVHTLKKKLQTDSSLLDFDILGLDTVICQNNCSGHGTCDQASKRCLCEAFWMENLFKLQFGDKESNCDWSILYVIIILFLVVITIFGFLWFMVCLCQRMRFRRPRKRHKYTLLKDAPDRECLSLVPKDKGHASSLMVSDSDLGSDTVFDQKLISGKSNGHVAISNGLVRQPRRVKT